MIIEDYNNLYLRFLLEIIAGLSHKISESNRR